MSLGMADRQARARRRLIWGLVKWAVALAGIGAAGFIAYRTGTDLAEMDLARLDEKVKTLSLQVQSLQTDNANLRVVASQAQQQAKQWQERYSAAVPTGNAKTVLDLANRKLAEGVPMDRLTQLIDTASNPRI